MTAPTARVNAKYTKVGSSTRLPSGLHVYKPAPDFLRSSPAPRVNVDVIGNVDLIALVVVAALVIGNDAVALIDAVSDLGHPANKACGHGDLQVRELGVREIPERRFGVSSASS